MRSSPTPTVFTSSIINVLVFYLEGGVEPPKTRDGVILPASVDDHDRKIGLGMALTSKMGRHRGFICSTMGDVETMAVNSRVEGLPSFSYVLETTPPALY